MSSSLTTPTPTETTRGSIRSLTSSPLYIFTFICVLLVLLVALVTIVVRFLWTRNQALQNEIINEFGTGSSFANRKKAADIGAAPQMWEIWIVESQKKQEWSETQPLSVSSQPLSSRKGNSNIQIEYLIAMPSPRSELKFKASFPFLAAGYQGIVIEPIGKRENIRDKYKQTARLPKQTRSRLGALTTKPRMAHPLPVLDQPLSRPSTSITTPPELSPAFLLATANKSYKHQFANIYFVRLSKLRKHVEPRAKERWKDVAGKPKLVPRVLDVVKGQLCYIIGTVYMEMRLKPNVLEDISKDHWIAAPPPRPKFNSSDDEILLEDESGRVRLVGERIKGVQLVTGIIMAALGIETASGDFEVVDVCFSGIPPQIKRQANDGMEVDKPGEWVGLISGLEVGRSTAASDIRMQLLVEYLTAEGGGQEDQTSGASISRLIIAGNSLVQSLPTVEEKRPRKYGYDAAAFSTHPLKTLSAHLLDICRSMPVHLVPGASDPAGATLPQQPLPRAMFGEAKNFEGFACETNPCWVGIDGCSFLGNSGQTIDDIFKYVSSTDRLSMARDTLKWRHMAPTAPDTLWCYPFFITDPFIIPQAPHIYFIGNQPSFQSELVMGEEHGQKTRIILVPKFSETGVLVLVHTRTLEVRTVEFGLGDSWGEGQAMQA